MKYPGIPPDPRRSDETRHDGRAFRRLGDPACRGHRYSPNLAVIIAVIVVMTFALLARALRLLWLPAKALLLNLISLAAAFGVLTFVWQEGHGTTALFSSPATGAVTLWVPLAVFALLFGLSMDYEVFILTRVNEAPPPDHQQVPFGDSLSLPDRLAWW